MLPYGLNQKVEFEKGFGPKLGEVNIDEMSRLDEVDFIQKVYPVYKAIKKVSTDDMVKLKYLKKLSRHLNRIFLKAVRLFLMTNFHSNINL